MIERQWALLIVDESHHVRCSKKKSESNEVLFSFWIADDFHIFINVDNFLVNNM